MHFVFPQLSTRHPQFRRVCGFSLVELLMVVAVISVLLSVVAPSLFGTHRPANINRAGNLMADTLSLARTLAMSKNTITAVVLAGDASGSASQALTVLELETQGPTPTWKQSTQWQRVPEAVMAVDGAPDTSRANSIATVDLRFDGDPVTDYTALVFFPDGRIANTSGSPRRFSVRYATDDPGADSAALGNYYDLVFSSNTATFRIQRP